jgi:VanZ family protein
MKVFRWSVLLVYVFIIFLLSTRPVGGVELFTHADKIIHFVMYAILAVLSFWVLRYTDLATRPIQLLIASALVATTYGAFIELVQSSLPYRSGEFGDIVANAVGALSGALLYFKIIKRRVVE